MGIPKQSTSKILPKPMAPPPMLIKSQTLWHITYMFLSSTISIRPSTLMNGWVLDHLSFNFKFLLGSELFKKYIDGNGICFTHLKPKRSPYEVGILTTTCKINTLFCFKVKVDLKA